MAWSNWINFAAAIDALCHAWIFTAFPYHSNLFLSSFFFLQECLIARTHICFNIFSWEVYWFHLLLKHIVENLKINCFFKLSMSEICLCVWSYEVLLVPIRSLSGQKWIVKFQQYMLVILVKMPWLNTLQNKLYTSTLVTWE